MYTKKQRGYSIVETLVAVSVLLVAIVGPMTIVVRSLQTAFYLQEQATAVFLAQEGIEGVVAERNRHVLRELEAGNTDYWDWASPSGPLLSQCLNAVGCNFDFTNDDPFGSGSAVSCSPESDCRMYEDTSSNRVVYSLDNSGTPSPYTRIIRITVDSSGDTSATVASTVKWNSDIFAAERSVTMYTELYNEFKP